MGLGVVVEAGVPPGVPFEAPSEEVPLAHDMRSNMLRRISAMPRLANVFCTLILRRPVRIVHNTKRSSTCIGARSREYICRAVLALAGSVSIVGFVFLVRRGRWFMLTNS